ncbi:hypothetical protein OROGR_027181 [Orobanche gracilis]
MYTREKTQREEKYNKSGKHPKDMPSFSSTLLDEIYRSIDVSADNSEDVKAYKEKVLKKQIGCRTKTNTTEEYEETKIFTRACLVEKLMEKEKTEKAALKRGPNLEPEKKSLQDNHINDFLFFSSTSCSNSDSSGALSSSPSDAEFFASQTKPKVSCFSTRPKPVRTGAPARGNKNNPQDDYSLFGSHEKNKTEDDLVNHKSMALKIYAHLKKVKQPISPGGRLTGFINSLFRDANVKKPGKIVDTDKKNLDYFKSRKAQPISCSSASSFSRSCLSKYSPKSRESVRSGDQRTVRFHPVSVIVDEEEDSGKYRKPPLPINKALADLKVGKMEKNRKVGENRQNDFFKDYSNISSSISGNNNNNNNNNKRRDYISMFRKTNGGDEEEDDGISDSSSDLFEIDHSAFLGNNRYGEELPVYETTHRLGINRGIPSRLIR